MTLRLRLLAAFIAILAVPVVVVSLVAPELVRDEPVAFAIAGGIGLVLAFVVADAFARPLRELSAVADRIAKGDLGARAPVRGGDELGRIAEAFNDVSEHLRRQMVDVEVTRDQLRKAVRRLGDALRSTHDLRQMLSVVLETSMMAVHGKAGAVYMLTSNRQELYVKVGRRIDPETAQRRLAVGDGLAGWVAKHQRAIRLPGGEDDAPFFAASEPGGETALAVPIGTQSQLLGVLAIYGREFDEPFREEDLETITSLAGQAGVGIENVLLHDEAKRLSITDGLTGIWNYRFFQMRLAQEFQRAIRFERPLSLLMIDIDHFKGINDEHGHQRGDAILIELVRRILGHTRLEVDTLARYGGEEFVLILPETGIEGARVVAEKIRHEVAAAPFGGDGEGPLRVTVSIGYASHPQHGITPQVLLHEADQALYAAKRQGRDRVIGADELAAGPSLAAGPAAQ